MLLPVYSASLVPKASTHSLIAHCCWPSNRRGKSFELISLWDNHKSIFEESAENGWTRRSKEVANGEKKFCNFDFSAVEDRKFNIKASRKSLEKHKKTRNEQVWKDEIRLRKKKLSRNNFRQANKQWERRWIFGSAFCFFWSEDESLLNVR